jgi:hypothetical protein
MASTIATAEQVTAAERIIVEWFEPDGRVDGYHREVAERVAEAVLEAEVRTHPADLLGREDALEGEIRRAVALTPAQRLETAWDVRR